MKAIHLIIAGLLLSTQASFAKGELPEKFTDGLTRARMTFEMPDGYTGTETIENPHMCIYSLNGFVRMNKTISYYATGR